MFYNFVKNIIGGLIKLFYPVKLINENNIPIEGPLILCSNHANNLDPIFISICFSRQISWMAKKELFNSKVLSFILKNLNAFPIDRQGSDISAIKNALRVLKAGRVLGIFPEGTRTKSKNLNNAKSGVALLGVKSKAPILPIYIDSNYKIFNRTNIIVDQAMYLEKEKGVKLDSNSYINMSKSILNKIYSLKEVGGNN